jgi:23S rRNA (guanosine2251-2'-O)-methyltransferase
MRKLKTWELGRISAGEFEKAAKIPVVIVLDNIRSGHNTGSVFRTADAFRIKKIYGCGHTCMPPHPEIYKTALGAEDTISHGSVPDILDCLKELKSKDYILIGVEQTDSSSALQDFTFSKDQHYAIVLGNEVNGVQQEALELCDHVLEIPQEGTKHSLNISVAAGVVLWEAFKQLR